MCREPMSGVSKILWAAAAAVPGRTKEVLYGRSRASAVGCAVAATLIASLVQRRDRRASRPALSCCQLL